MVEKKRKGLRVLSAAILSSLACAMLTACSVKEPAQEIAGAAEGEEVTLSVSFSVPAMGRNEVLTRAHGFGRQQIENLYLVLFDENGYFVESARVFDLQQTDPGYSGQGLPDNNLSNQWQVNGKVRIHATDRPVIAHLVANYDCSALGFDSEQEVINKMVTSFTRGDEYFGGLMRLYQGTVDSSSNGYGAPEAYWQRVELPDGLPAGQAKLQRVPLLRNMCRIKVRNIDPDFKMLGYMVVNVPDRGTVAPFNTISGVYQPFAFAETTGSSTNGQVTYTNYDYTDITDTHHYTGYTPLDVNRLSPDHYTGGSRGWTSDLEVLYWNQPFFQSVYVRGTSGSGSYHTIQSGAYPAGTDIEMHTYNSWGDISEAPSEPFYLYESPYTGDPDTYTYLIIRGRRSDETTYNVADYWYDYYKVDLVRNVDGRTEYYNLLRNFEYEVVIYDVAGRGYTTAEEAARHIAGNNVNASVLAHDLRNVSDGEARLFVSDVDFVRTSASTAVLYYKFIRDIDDPDNTIDNTIYDAGTQQGQGVHLHIGNGSIFPSVTVAASDEATGTYKGWRKITVTLPENTGTEKLQTLTLYTVKTFTAGTETVTTTQLQRDIHFRTRPPYDFAVYFLDADGTEQETVSVAASIGASLPVRVKLPAALPSYIFPLQIGFEATQNSLSPGTGSQVYTEVMPSLTGTGNAIYMTRTLTEAEYGALATQGTWRYFDVPFVTSTAASASDLIVGNPYYFTPVTRSFTNLP